MIFRVALLLGFLASPALADPALVNFGLGATDILGGKARSAAEVRLEYRSGISLLPFAEAWVKVKPWLGVEETGRRSTWAGGGIWLDIPISTHWVLSPSIGVGYYDRGGGKNLGSTFQIRSQIEGGYVFANQTRLVGTFGHTSDAGVSRHNPGMEAAVVSFQFPLPGLFGG